MELYIREAQIELFEMRRKQWDFSIKIKSICASLYIKPGLMKGCINISYFRLAWNKQDTNYLATVAMDACEVNSKTEN